MKARRSTPRGLLAGAALLALLALLALGAPLWATDRPWLARDGDGGVSSPALARLLGFARSDRRPAPAAVLLRAPIPHEPNRMDLAARLESPSRRHWMGTDGLGRDLAARLVYGARVSLGVGLLAAAFALLVGLPLGALAGYRGGWTDAAVSRCIETVLCFPTLLLALALLAAGPAWLGRLPDPVKIALVLGLTGWVPVTRYLRGEFLRLRDSDVVQAARAAGGGHLRVVVLHLLPAALAPVLVTTAFAVAASIALEAALSFLGLGVQSPTPTWGGLLDEARAHVHRAWWLALFPGLALFVSILACNLIGEGVRDLLDPRAEG